MRNAQISQGWLILRRLSTARTGLLVAAITPILLLGIVLALVTISGAGLSAEPVAPIESLTVQRLILHADGLTVSVMNGGPEPVTIAQVIVDNAVWSATVLPSATLPRFGQATVHIPYPWVEGDRHEVKLITSNGLIFSGSVEVAAPSPEPTSSSFINFTLLGIYVGIIPISLGLLWFPFLRRLGRGGMAFVLSLTVGLLIFLAADTLLEALEVAGRLAGVFQGTPLVFFVTLLSFLALVAIGHRRSGDSSRLRIAYLIALGIGLHNLGEGLAIGAAFALGEAALGTFLVIGFTLHNITEGIGIGAPVASERPALAHFVRLGLLAGSPAIIGTWIGGYVYSDLAATLFMAIGTGAILQVIYEVVRLLGRERSTEGRFSISPAMLSGLVSGITIMYVTAMLVKF